MSDFKVGDEIRCINNRGYEHILTLNRVYRVIYVGSIDVKVIDGTGNQYYFLSNRFQLVTSSQTAPVKSFKIGDLVKCTKPSYGTPYTLNNVYEVKAVDSSGHWITIMGDDGHDFNAVSVNFTSIQKDNTVQTKGSAPLLLNLLSRNATIWNNPLFTYSGFPTSISIPDTPIKIVQQKCTCGTKISMGSSYNIDHCSSWCDLKGKA